MATRSSYNSKSFSDSQENIYFNNISSKGIKPFINKAQLDCVRNSNNQNDIYDNGLRKMSLGKDPKLKLKPVVHLNRYTANPLNRNCSKFITLKKGDIDPKLNRKPIVMLEKIIGDPKLGKWLRPVVSLQRIVA